MKKKVEASYITLWKPVLDGQKDIKKLWFYLKMVHIEQVMTHPKSLNTKAFFFFKCLQCHRLLLAIKI